MNKESYKEIFEKATAPGATQDDIDHLGDWFESYGAAYWNGEYFDADGLRLFPVTEWSDKYEEWELVGYEIR